MIFKLVRRCFLFIVCSLVSLAAISTETHFWDTHNATSITKINHQTWQILLDRYLNATHASGINRFHYAAVSKPDKKLLEKYLHDLQNIDPRRFNKQEQKAYWINLYNATTVNVVLDNQPKKSIREIKSGFFSFGPWQKKLVTVAGQTLSLDDIEHKILRPLWQDERIHYALNCASLGCPNLLATAFTADNIESLLNQGAVDYINHPRGVTINGERIILSKIYKWYQQDFADNEAQLIDYLKRYAQPALAKELSATKTVHYEYDWSLNKP